MQIERETVQLCYTKHYYANPGDDLFSSYCQMLWTGFDSGGVLDLDPIDELRPRDHGPEAG